MSETAAEETAAESQGTCNFGHLPWQQIPNFQARVTNLDEYSQKLRLLKERWPSEHLHLLAPMAALDVEGAAFQKIARLDRGKPFSENRVQILVESLGGTWGKTKVEERYHFFEQAIYQVGQKADESNDSYLARHDYDFEELLTRGVTLEEIRA